MNGLRRAAAEFDDYLRVERGASRNTVEAYARDMRRYLGVLAARGHTDPGTVEIRDVTAVLQAIADAGAAASTIARALAAIRHFHKFCVREGLAVADPAALAEAPTRPSGLPKALHEDDVTAIIEAADRTTPAGLRDRAILEMLYAAGVRASELTGLDVDDVDLEARVLRCLGKGNRERIVPIGVPAADAIRRYLREGRPSLASRNRRTGAALFLSARGGRLSRQSCWKVVKRYAAVACPDARVFPHAFRHSFATHLVAHGADLRVVQEALGHARLSTTQVYTLVERRTLKTVLENAHPRGTAAPQPK